MRIFGALYFLFASFLLHSQDTYQPDRIFSPSELQADFDILVESLQNLHPGFYQFKSKEDFDKYINDTRSSLTQEMTEVQFQNVARKLIKEIGCGHALAYPSASWYEYQSKNPKGIPISTYLLNDRLFLRYHSQDSLAMIPGCEILSINDRNSGEIIQSMRSIQQRDGYSLAFVNSSISKYFTTYHLFLYGRSDEYTVEYRDNNGDIVTTSLVAGARQVIPQKNKPVAFKGKGMRLFYDSIQPNLAILDIETFSSKSYKKNYKYIFKELEKKQIKYLVIDLRDNSGGFFPNGNTLLRYLLPEKFTMNFSRPKGKPKNNPHAKMSLSNKMTRFAFNLAPDQDKADPLKNNAIKYKPKKKNHFDGEIFVITNGGSFSMSSLVTTRLKHDRNAKIVGSETGGGEAGSYAILNHRLNLPNTKVRVLIPYYFLDHDVTPEVKGMGVIPDMIVEETIEDLISDTDKPLEAVRRKIRSNNM